MGLFSNPAEDKRRQSLKDMEDARLRFAQDMQAKGFAPDGMLILSTDRGGYIALCRHEGKTCLIESPDFGAPGEFILHTFDALPAVRQEHFLPAEGMGGAFGFGKKGEKGFILTVTLPERQIILPFIANRASAMIGSAKLLLSTKRRRGDANLAWDLSPIDSKLLEKLDQELKRY